MAREILNLILHGYEHRAQFLFKRFMMESTLTQQKILRAEGARNFDFFLCGYRNIRKFWSIWVVSELRQKGSEAGFYIFVGAWASTMALSTHNKIVNKYKDHKFS